MRYRAPTIEQQGGLRAYLEGMGKSYDLFVLLLGRGLNNTAIAKALGVRQASTVKHWREVHADEQTN